MADSETLSRQTRRPGGWRLGESEDCGFSGLGVGRLGVGRPCIRLVSRQTCSWQPEGWQTRRSGVCRIGDPGSQQTWKSANSDRHTGSRQTAELSDLGVGRLKSWQTQRPRVGRLRDLESADPESADLESL